MTRESRERSAWGREERRAPEGRPPGWLHPRVDALRAAGDQRSLGAILTRRFPRLIAVELLLLMTVLFVVPSRPAASPGAAPWLSPGPPPGDPDGPTR